jgi:hypothetical protein
MSEGVNVAQPAVAVNLEVTGTGDRLAVYPEKLIVAGYTAKDEAAVAEHIAELAAIGVPPPATVPAFYDLDPALLTSAAVVEVAGPSTSGEVEPVLVRHRGRYYLTVGSDHTDRELERTGIAESKAACPKPLGTSAVELGPDLSSVRWEGISAESSVDGTPYQKGDLRTLRDPSDLVERMDSAIGEISGDLVIFCGTLPLLTGEFVHGHHWRIQLTLPDGARLTHAYETKQESKR